MSQEWSTWGSLEDPPSANISIIYPGNKNVEFGKELTPTEVKDCPQVSWAADPKKFYTLLMYDPDAPSRQDPKFADVLHWLVVNILGSDLSTGTVVAEYIGSGAPKGTGLHRYTFLVFEQAGKLEFNEPYSSVQSREHRLKWSMTEFKKRNGLRVYAGNFFQAQWDPYVDERRKQMENSNA